MESRNLGSVMGRGQELRGETRDRDVNVQNFNNFLTIFSLNLTHRFPDVTNLDTIDTNTVRNIAEFSLACSRIATDTWTEMNQSYVRRRTAA